MAVRVAPKPAYVASCVPRQDGGWMILTKVKGEVGSSPVELPEGTQIIIRDGKAERLHP